jgi:hypothetical protein
MTIRLLPDRSSKRPASTPSSESRVGPPRLTFYLSRFTGFLKWTLTKDGKDYDHRFRKIGCGNVTGLNNKPGSNTCACNHNHQLKQKNTKKTIADKSKLLKFGE